MRSRPSESETQPHVIRLVPLPSGFSDSAIARAVAPTLKLRATGATYSVAQAIGRNPFMIIVPCHRVLEAGNYADKMAPNGGVMSKRRLLTIEGAHPTVSKTLFDVLLPPVAPPRPHN